MTNEDRAPIPGGDAPKECPTIDHAGSEPAANPALPGTTESRLSAEGEGGEQAGGQDGESTDHPVGDRAEAAMCPEGVPSRTPDPYAILGVNRDDCDEQVKATTFELLARHHPCAGGDSKARAEIEDAFQRILQQRAIEPVRRPANSKLSKADVDRATGRRPPGALTAKQDGADDGHVALHEQPSRPVNHASLRMAVGYNNGRPCTKAAANQPDPMALRLEELHHRCTGDLLIKIEQQRDLGLSWKEAKKTTIPKSGLNVEQWVKKHLTFTQQHANACLRLAKDYEKYLGFHYWYQQSGISLGYRVHKHNGYEYMFAAAALYVKWQRAEPPEPFMPKPKPAQQRKTALKQDFDRVRSELERVVSLYRATPQGEGFESPVLVSMKAADTPVPISEDDSAAGAADDQQDEAGTPGKFDELRTARRGNEADQTVGPPNDENASVTSKPEGSRRGAGRKVSRRTGPNTDT